MNTVVTKKQVNRLTAAMSYKLCNLIASLNEKGIITHDSSWKGLADYCSKELGYELTPANIQGAFTALELKLPQAPRTKEQQLEDRIETLEGMVKYMCTNLGLTSPY